MLKNLLSSDVDPNEALKAWTNVGLCTAVLIGISIVVAHGSVRSTGIAAFGAALGLGGILGFLFGVPNVNNGSVNINDAGAVAVGSGKDSNTVAEVRNGNAAVKGPAPTINAVNLAPPDAINTPPPAKDPVPDQDKRTTLSTSSSRPIVSNLEQVADWVTKLLLGGGLTQLGHIPPKIWQWSRMVALGLIGDNKNVTEQMIVAQQAFAAGLLVYGFVLGFFGGFLITKLQLGKAISS